MAQELEALYVRIFAQFDATFKNMEKIVSTEVAKVNVSLATLGVGMGQAFFGRMLATMTHFRDMISAIMSGVGKANASLATLGSGGSLLSLGKAATSLSARVVKMSTSMAAIIPIASNFTQILAQLSFSFAAFTAAAPAAGRLAHQLGRIASSLTRIATNAVPAAMGLSTFIVGLTTAATIVPQFEELSKALGRVGGFLRNVTKADLTKVVAASAPIAQFSIEFGKLATSMTNVLPVVAKLSLALQRVGSFIRAVAKVDIVQFDAACAKLVLSIRKLVAALATIDTTKLTSLAKSLDSVMAFSKTKADRAAAAIRGIGGATRGGAASGIGSINRSLGSMVSFLRSASEGTAQLRFGLVALAGYSVYLFASLDDSLTRVMAHLRDWNRTTEGTLESGIFKIASSSRTGPAELATGLDVLANSGMNAAMAVKALAIAETFSVASGMKMEDATQRLVDVQRALNLNSENVEQHYANMTRLSNILVGVSREVGSTEMQMADALSGKFATAMRQANMSMEEGIALLGTYSQAGKVFRGTAGGDTAARVMQALMSKNIENQFRWAQMGVRVFDGSKMRPMVQIIDDLTQSLGNMGPMAQEARLKFLGFEARTIHGIMALVGRAGEMRSIGDELKNLGDISDQTANMMRENFTGQLKILWNQVQIVAQVIGKALAPALAWVARQLQSVLVWFKSLSPAVQQFVVYAALATVAIVPAISLLVTVGSTVLGVLSGVIGALVGMASGIVTVVSALFSLGWLIIPVIGGAAIAIIGLAAVLLGLAKSFSTLSMSWDEMAEGASGAVTGIAGFFNNFEENMTILWDWVKDNWKELLDFMLDASITFGSNFLHNFIEIFKTLAQIIKVLLIDWFIVNWEVMMEDMGALTTILYINVGINFSVLTRTISRMFAALLGWMSDNAPVMFAGIGIALLYVFFKAAQKVLPIAKQMMIAFADGALDAARGRAPDARREAARWASLWREVSADFAGGGTRGDLGGTMSNIVRDARRDMIPLLQGFSAQTPSLWGHISQNTDTANMLMREGFNRLRTPFEGLVNHLPAMNLNLGLPGVAADIGTGMAEGWRRMMKPFEEPLGEGAPLSGKPGPGFTFKQISLERTMLGGGAAESLDYQQLVVLQAISKGINQLVIAANGIEIQRPIPPLGR